MMRSRRLLALFLAGVLSSTAAAQKPGERVVVTAKGAPLRTRAGTSGKVPRGNILTVHGSEGTWLWVVWSDGKGPKLQGWMTREDVISFDRALEFFSEELRRAPSADTYNTRGAIFSEQGKLEEALKDFEGAIRLDPSNAKAFSNRGAAWALKGEYARAVEDNNQAIRLDESDAYGYNNLAWLRATCADESFRDGKQAVELAKKACGLTDWGSPVFLDTLAAAYAESQEFDSAVKWQERAVELSPARDKAAYESRMAMYKNGEPMREPRIAGSEK